MRPLFLLALLLSASTTHAAPARRKGWLSGLSRNISAYLNAPVVRKSPNFSAVAAVRGGIPKDQGEDLDQRLLDRAFELRRRALGGPRPDEAEALRRVYRALAASQWVQALEKDRSDKVMTQETAYALRAWTRTQDDLAVSLKNLLLGPAKDLGGDALVAAGWGDYCRGLTPRLEDPGQSQPGRLAAADTAELDELLKSLQDTWTTRRLPAAKEAKAHQLAGEVYSKLAEADFQGSRAAASSGGAAPALVLPSAPAPGPQAGSAASDEAPFTPRKIYGKASKAVVLIVCADRDGSGELGSGSLLDDQGRILTNAHVVIRDSTRKPWEVIRVYLKPAKMTGDPKQDMTRPLEARVASWDTPLDLALLELAEPPSGLSHLALADPEDVVIGDRVAAIGHPEQGGLWTLTTGVVSTLVADLGGVKGKTAFQTDASINRGNSGGPLLNAAGDIIGVNTLMSRKAADGLAITAVNFAVRSDIARRWLAGATMNVAYAPPAAPAVRAAASEERTPSAGPTAPVRKPRPVTITESRPFDREQLIEEQVKEMEDLGDEMHDEILRKTRKKP